jgi:hypothetical protein
MKSWKTTVAGIAAAVAAIGTAVNAQFDNDPSTNAEWGLVIAAVSAAIGLFTARDNDKSSEDVDVR